jgi:virulence factor Mce-like protein
MHTNTVTVKMGAVLAAAAMVAGVTSCGDDVKQRATSHCAILPDAVGLYLGNPVTQMGFPIGRVDRITPSDMSVQVDFSLADPRQIPADVKVVVRSTSILADRALELVGNFEGGPELVPGECVPLDRSMTPKSLSEVIGAANTFVDGINPETSSNIGDVVTQLDQAALDSGAGLNQILSTSSTLLDNPDGAISDMSSIVGNLGVLTDSLVGMRDPMKQIINDAVITTPYLVSAMEGAEQMSEPLSGVVTMLSDMEVSIGEELQLTLDATADAMRIMTPHARGLASLLDPLPWWINGATHHFNNREFVMSFRPPLYRIRTPNGPAVCHFMNLSMPGSCANVAGQPYGVDINLLQYVFLNASQQ